MTVLALGSAVCGSLGSLYDYQKTAQAGLPEPRGLGASGMVEGVMMATMLAQPRWPVSTHNRWHEWGRSGQEAVTDRTP